MSRDLVLYRVSRDGLADRAEELLATGFRLALVAAHDDGGRMRVVYLFLAGRPDRRVELECVVPASDPAVQSLAYLSFPAGRFEREMADLYGIRPIGHPRPRRLVRHAHWPEDWYPMRADAGSASEFASTGRFPFVTVEGTGVYEIPVGPVHAGLIEPGHFRFSVVGETILRLKARLWFVHRGMEKLFHGRTAEGGVELAERISGDTSAGHASGPQPRRRGCAGWRGSRRGSPVARTAWSSWNGSTTSPQTWACSPTTWASRWPTYMPSGSGSGSSG